jgi:disulfide bond formation protein DsbB
LINKYLLINDKFPGKVRAIVFPGDAVMNFGATLFLRAVLVLIGVGVLTFLLVEPHLEGRNAHATPFEIYFKDPFLAYLYIASIPFFVGLYHAIKVLGYAARNREFSPSTLKSVRTIKHCAIALIGFVAGAEVFILSNEGDDGAGAIVMGAFIAFVAIVVATAMAVLERTLQKAVDLKSENDLTV